MSQQPNISDFELLNVLGSGSYSTVYRARNKISNQYVAIKSVAQQRLTATSTENLLQEIKLLKTLHHRFIVEMFDFRWDNRNIYLVLELCNLGDLSAFIRNQRKLPEATCKFFLRQVALALQYMRENNVSHFDLKPQNLLLTKTPNITIKVADFGFAQHVELNETHSDIRGSPLYMAPEILLSRCYDPSADLWSIGCILHECIFGFAPYRSKSMDELLIKIKNKQKIPIPPLCSATTPSSTCIDFLKRLLVHEPKQRIGFVEFFAHHFLDLKHEPNDENLRKAIEIFTRAVQLDHQSKYKDAYDLYCQGLEYFVACVNAECDPAKKQILHEKANAYLKRAEEIKKLFSGGCCEAHINKPSANTSKSATSVTQPRPFDRQTSVLGQNLLSVSAASDPTPLYTKLISMCGSNLNMKSGLEIGRQAEMYLIEKKDEVAVDMLRTALGLLVPLLEAEPTGQRKDLLHYQIITWMKEAECAKLRLTTDTLETSAAKSASYVKNCCIQ